MFDISDFVNVTTVQSSVSKIKENVKKRRKALKFSQKLLALKSGVSYGSVRRFESTGDISLVSLLKIANALDCLEDFGSLFAKTPIADLKDLKI